MAHRSGPVVGKAQRSGECNPGLGVGTRTGVSATVSLDQPLNLSCGMLALGHRQQRMSDVGRGADLPSGNECELAPSITAVRRPQAVARHLL